MHLLKGEGSPLRQCFPHFSSLLLTFWSKLPCPMSQNLSGSWEFDIITLKSISTKALMHNSSISFSENICFQVSAFITLIWNCDTGKDRERGIMRQRKLLPPPQFIYSSHHLVSWLTSLTYFKKLQNLRAEKDLEISQHFYFQDLKKKNLQHRKVKKTVPQLRTRERSQDSWHWFWHLPLIFQTLC